MIGVCGAMRASLSMTTTPSAPKFEVMTSPSANCPTAHSSISSTPLDSNRWESCLISSSVNLLPPYLKRDYEINEMNEINENLFFFVYFVHFVFFVIPLHFTTSTIYVLSDEPFPSVPP